MSSGLASNIQAKAQEVAGILYFIMHRSLWKPFYSRILTTLGINAGVLIFMFFFTYLPQLAILVFINGPLAVFTTVIMILNESTTVANMISRNFLLRDALLDTFDGTLVARDAIGIVSEGRQLKSGNDPIARLGKILKNPLSKFTPKALIRYVMFLPLNIIPFFGIIAFLLFQVGAALWAADIEQKNTQMTEDTSPNLRDSTRKAE
ncbi:hypothetical protein AAE478_008543 [Parahypoxylon ruwenzoriense]